MKSCLTRAEAYRLQPFLCALSAPNLAAANRYTSFLHPRAYPAPHLNNEKIVQIFFVFSIAKNPEMSYNTLGRLFAKIHAENAVFFGTESWQGVSL
jgi:hypothetical protein